MNIEDFSQGILLSAVFSLLGHCVFAGNHIVHAQSVNSTIFPDKVGVKINFPKANSTIPVGTLTINGTSSDTTQTDCRVHVDWNDLKPMQNVTPTGINGKNDYSSWNFTYDKRYHIIAEGTNELTSKIICTNNPSGNTTKFYSINITGTMSNSSSLSSAPNVPTALNQTVTNSSGYHTISYQGILPQYNRAILDDDEGSTADNNESENNEKTEKSVPYKGDESSSGKQDNHDDENNIQNTNEESEFVGSFKDIYSDDLTAPNEKVNNKVEKIKDEEFTNDHKINIVKKNFDSDNDEEKHKDTKTSNLDKIKKKFQKSIFKKTALYDGSELEKSIKSTIKKRLGKVVQDLLN